MHPDETTPGIDCPGAAEFPKRFVDGLATCSEQVGDRNLRVVNLSPLVGLIQHQFGHLIEDRPVHQSENPALVDSSWVSPETSHRKLRTGRWMRTGMSLSRSNPKVVTAFTARTDDLYGSSLYVAISPSTEPGWARPITRRFALTPRVQLNLPAFDDVCR